MDAEVNGALNIAAIGAVAIQPKYATRLSGPLLAVVVAG